MLRGIVLVSGAACVGSCGGEGVEDPAAAVARASRGEAAVPACIPLVPAPITRLPRAEPRRVARLELTRDPDGWSLAASRVRRTRNAEGSRVLRARGAGTPVRLSIDGPFEPGSFNRVRLHAWFVSKASLELRGLRGREVVVRAPPVQGTPFFDGTWTDLDAPAFALESLPFDTLEVVVHAARPVDLAAVELWDVPLEHFYGASDPGEAYLDVAGEIRRGVLARSGEACTVTVTGAGAGVLAWSACVPSALRSGGGVRLRTSWVDGRGGTRSQVHELDAQPAGPETWQEFELAFDAGGHTVTFEVLGDGDAPAICAVAEMRAVRPRPAPPTVLLVTSDTHRADGIACAPHALAVETPTVDALARRGALFEACWSATNITQPSHATILTGIHPRDTGHVTNSGSLLDEARTLAECFRDAGFRTMAAVSVFHLGAESGLHQGFDRVAAPRTGVRDAGQTAEILRSWLPSADGVPLFAWLHVFDAHSPYEPPEPFDRKYYPADRDPYDPSLPAPDICEPCLPEGFRGLRDLAFARAQYRAEIDYLDRALGELLEAPRWNGALVAFTADHGEVLKGRASLFNHGILAPATLRVPLVIAGPGVPAGIRRTDAVTHLDLGRTLLDCAGLGDVPFPGRDLFAEEERRAEEPVFALSADGKTAAVASGGWFLVLHLRDHIDPSEDRRRKHAVELYSLDAGTTAEPRNDLSASEPERARRMRVALVDWLGRASDQRLASHVPPPVALASRLAELGYASDPDWAPQESWFDAECDCEPCAAWR